MSAREVSSGTKKMDKPISPIVTYYLVAYNLVQVAGWSYMFWQFVNYLLIGGENGKDLWSTIKLTVVVFQNLALLEVVHASVGFVKSNPIITLAQVLSRIGLVFMLCYIRDAQTSAGLQLAILAWSITEIIRYSLYATSLLKTTVNLLVWLRYSTFLILYPAGVTGELLCYYHALPFIKESKVASIEMPNNYNFTFSTYYLVIIVMLTYIPGFPVLFGHMLTQRKKVLGGIVKQKAN